MTSYTPKGVCSRQINIEVNGDTIESVQFVGGCNGNTQGISSLVKGMKVDEVIARLEGINCLFQLLFLLFLLFSFIISFIKMTFQFLQI